MATPRTPNQKKRYTALNKRLAKYVSLVQSIYDQLGLEAANIVTTATNYDGSKPFRFKDYPSTKARVNDLMRYFSHDLQALIYSGTTEEWKQSNLVQDLLANDVLKVYGMRRDGEKVKRYYQTNNDALKAFQRRKDKGMTVSQKIWNQHYNFKQELEYAISSAIEKGHSAVTLSKRISKYLHDFPSLQKDYKERYGTATDCNDCEYRSIRLARSEINMAYREAEQIRWQQMDFIKGYEIKLSGSHPRYDICDELAGIYPKWFRWTSWHPNCLCICIPIVMTDDEWYSGNGQEITELPDQFTAWFHDNGERILKAENKDTLPYWIKDNMDKLSEQMAAAKRGAGSIQMSRNARKAVYDVLGKEEVPVYSAEQKQNHLELEQLLKTKKEPYMSFEDANTKRGNSNDDGSGYYSTNCQCCVYAHELRRRGFDVTAMGNRGGEFYKDLEVHTERGWVTLKAKTPEKTPINSKGNNFDEIERKIRGNVSNGGRYTLEWDFTPTSGHIVCMEVINNQLVIYDPQSGEFNSLKDIIQQALPSSIKMLRVDRLLVNLDDIEKIVTKV